MATKLPVFVGGRDGGGPVARGVLPGGDGGLHASKRLGERGAGAAEI